MINSWFRNCDFIVENNSFIPKQKKLRRNLTQKWKFAIKNGSFSDNSFAFST